MQDHYYNLPTSRAFVILIMPSNHTTKNNTIFLEKIQGLDTITQQLEYENVRITIQIEKILLSLLIDSIKSARRERKDVLFKNNIIYFIDGECAIYYSISFSTEHELRVLK